jgi:SWI/SNF-related matrix-associated actin-dependent regulator of chromatin subfamily A-like protein 1
MLDIAEVNNGFEVKFQYKPWLVEAIKKIPGSRFNGGKKHWWVPATSGSVLLSWAATFGSSVKQTTAAVEVGEIEPLPELTIEIPLKMQMFPYQGKGVAYSLLKERVIVGDQPGLGKTGQAIATAEANGCKCILIICPATLKENWRIEIEEKWTDKKALVLRDRVKATWPQYYKVGMIKYFICNYESLKKFFVESINKPEDKPLRLNHIKFKDTIDLFDMVIIDEVHRCKDGRTQQAKFVMGITKGKKWVLALTGTPVVNKPIDLIPQLHIIGRLQDFGGYKGFVDRYCQGSSQASNLKELNYLMHKTCFYRREKTEVLKDLPDKMRNIVRVDITNRAEYNKAENHLIEYLRENLNKSEGEISKSLRGETMVLIGILKKISARGKIEDILEHIREVVEAGEKIVVFVWHKEMVQELKKAIPAAVTIVGDNTLEERQRAVEMFQNDPKTQVIICNIKSGGVGITLTASSRVCFLELPWHPADCEQCKDRCHRIGQKDSVQCTYFLGHETIDEYIYNIIEKKRVIVNQVTGGEDNIETNVIDEFINLFTKAKL